MRRRWRNIELVGAARHRVSRDCTAQGRGARGRVASSGRTVVRTPPLVQEPRAEDARGEFGGRTARAQTALKLTCGRAARAACFAYP